MAICWCAIRYAIERKRAEEELRQLNAELEQRVVKRIRDLAEANERLKELDRLKSKFVSDVSHELRSPLMTLKLYAGLLETSKPEKRAEYLKTLNQHADRLAQLVEDILNLSKLELGANHVEFASVDLNELVARVVGAHQAPAEAAGLMLTFTGNDPLPLVWGESSQLTQVITNLVVNAINYTTTGYVHISTRVRGE